MAFNPNHFDLSLRDLRAVEHVARLQHFGRAAEALGIAQPTLSAQVNKVERAMGIKLFERSTRRFLTTPDGHRILPLLRETLHAHERLGQASHSSQHHTPPLRIGIIPTLGAYFAPYLLNAGSAAKVKLSITEEQTPLLLAKLLDGELDAALLSIPVKQDSITSIPICDEPFLLLAPKKHDLLKLRPLSPAALEANGMVLLSDGHCLRDQALAVCGGRGEQSPRLVATSLETLKYLVAAGEGYTLLPAMTSHVPKGLRDRVELRDFDSNCPWRRIGLCMRRTSVDRSRIDTLAKCLRVQVPRDTGVQVVLA